MSSESVTARAIRAKNRQSRAQRVQLDAVKRALAAANALVPGAGSGSKRKGVSDKDEKQSTDEGAQKRPRVAAAAEPNSDAAPAPAAASAAAAPTAAAAPVDSPPAERPRPVLDGEEVAWDDFDWLVALEYGLITYNGAGGCVTDFGTVHLGDYVSVNYRRDEKAETSVGFIEVDNFERDEKTGRVVVRGHWLWSLQDFRESGEMNAEIESLTVDEPDVLIQSKVPHECDLSDVNGFLDENRIPTLFYDFETRDILPHERRNAARAHASDDGDSTATAMALPAAVAVSETDSFIGFLGADPKFMFDNKYGASLLAYVDSKIERLHVKQARADTTLNVPESLLKAWGHGRIVCSEMKKPHGGICGLCGRQQLIVAFMDIHSPGAMHFIDGLDKVDLDECCYETVRHIVRLRNCLSSMQARWREYDREKRRSGVYLRDWQSEINALKLAKEARRRTYLPTEKEKEAPPAAAAAAAAVAEAGDGDADGEEEF